MLYRSLPEDLDYEPRDGRGAYTGPPVDPQADWVWTELDEYGHSGPRVRVPPEEYERRRILYRDQDIGKPPDVTTPGGGPTGDGPFDQPPAGRPDYGPVPQFNPPTWDNVPEFNWTEQWKQPTFDEAYADPGYQFGSKEGSRAIQQAAAAKGALDTGGTLKDLYKWGQSYANQQYGNVFDRKLTGYNTRFGTAKDIWANKYGSSRDQFDRRYTSAKDKYAPNLFEWQTNAQGANAGFNQDWYNYWKDNVSGNDIFQAGLKV